MKGLNFCLSMIIFLNQDDAETPVTKVTAKAPLSLVNFNCDKQPKDAMTCLSCQVYFESRGESSKGQLAVAKVTLNRANSDRNLVCAKVYEKNKKTCQFSWTCDGKSHVMTDKKAIKKAMHVASQALKEGPDRFDHFYATRIAEPYWAKNMECRSQGRHTFCDSTTRVISREISTVTVAGN